MKGCCFRIVGLFWGHSRDSDRIPRVHHHRHLGYLIICSWLCAGTSHLGTHERLVSFPVLFLLIALAAKPHTYTY